MQLFTATDRSRCEDKLTQKYLSRKGKSSLNYRCATLADCRLADYISCYLYKYILYIPIPLSISIPIPIPIYLYLYEALVWLTEVLVWLTQARQSASLQSASVAHRLIMAFIEGLTSQDLYLKVFNTNDLSIELFSSSIFLSLMVDELSVRSVV